MMAPPIQLTQRQAEVVRLLDAHLTQAEVAEKLGISPRTVQDHAARLRQITGSTTTREAVSRARPRASGARSETP